MDKALALGGLIARPSNADDEEAMLRLLREASGAELNEMVCANEMHRLYDSVDNHLFGTRNRDALVDLLARERREDLDVMSAAGFLYALQRGVTTKADAVAIRDMIVATRGEELTRLKNQINDRVDAYDLEGLVFGQLRDKGLRSDVLDHITAEAGWVDTGQAKVLIDIDDTTISALHDQLYPRGAVYPGALALYEGLDLGANPPPFSTEDLIFVTARPGDALGVIDHATSLSLRKAGLSTPTISSGRLRGLFSKRGMADGKLRNIRHLRALFPEYGLVFIGDSGQGDVLVAEQLVAEFGDAVWACFIHDVVDTPDAERASFAASGIHFFDTYVGAALVAETLGLINAERVSLIVDTARRQFNRIEFSSAEHRERAATLLDRDIAAAGPRG